MAILLSVVFGLLVYPIHVAGLTLCDTDGTLEVVENKTNNVFTCTGAVTTHTIFWIYQRSIGNTGLATCSQLPASCNNPYKPQFKASRPADDRSTFTVNGSTTSYLQYIQGQTIVCRTSPAKGSPGSPQQTQCTVDIVAAPSVTCDAHYNTGTSSPWTVTGNCSVSGAYSYLNRYTCNLIQTSPTTKSLGSGSLTVTSTSGSGGKYKTGYCQVTVPYPDVTGVYSYKMAVTPGRQEVNASFGEQKSFEIKRPSTPPSHNCPQYVGGSQGTSCTCTATDLGQPAGVVRWASTMTNQLSLSNVNKNDNGATYTCQVIWNGHRTQSVTYTLQVAHGPSSVSITHPPFPYDTNGQQQLTLTCSASDVDPAPTFTWGKGSASNVVGQGRTYTFRPQPPGDDNSVFVCRAVNSITGTSQQDSTTLTLNYPPTQNPVITITSTPSNSGGHPHQGDRVTLTCAVTGGKPFGATTVTFTCPGKQDSPDIVGSSGVTSTVTFDILTAADHDKVCTCTPSWKNTTWYNKNETVRLLVNYPPSVSLFEVNSSPASTLTVNASDVLNLSCRAVGRPPPETKLIHPSKTLIAKTPQGSPSVADTPSVVSGKLTARCRDTGIYTCTADNTVGSAQQQTISIFVQCKPEPRNDAGDGSIPPVNYRTEAVQLNFSVTAYPVPELKRVKFFKQKPDDTAVGQAAEEGTVAVECFPDSNVSADVTCQVTVDNITLSHSGFYQAFVGNDFGDLKLEFEVLVNATYVEADAPDFPIGVVVGVIVAVLVVSAIIIVVVLVIRRRRGERQKPPSASSPGIRDREEPGDYFMITNTAYVSSEDAAPQRNQPSTSQASSSPYEDVDVPNAKPVIKPKPKPKPQHGASAAQVATTGDVYATVNKKNGPQSTPEDSSPVYAVVNKKKKAPAELPTATPGAMEEKPKVGKKPASKKPKQKGKGNKETKKEDELTLDPAQSTSSDPSAVYDNVTPLSMSPPPPPPEGSVYANFGFQRDDSADKDHKPEPEGSRTVNLDGLVYITIGFSEEQRKKANDPPPERVTTNHAALDYSKMETQ